MTNRYDAIVIGAGPNGLMAAAYLAKRGKKVVVCEAASGPYGHLRLVEIAPKWGAPLSYDGGAVLDNVARELGLPAVPPPGAPLSLESPDDIAFSVAADDGSLLSIRVGSTRTDGIARHSAKDARRWPEFAAQFAAFTDILARLYQNPPPDIDTTSLSDVLPLAMIGLKVRGLGRGDMTEFLRIPPMSIQDYVDDAFECELLRTGLASHAVRDLRQGPRSGGTTFNLLHHMVGSHRLGGRPQDFLYATESALKTLAAPIRLNSRVVRIVVKNDAVAGVALASGEEISADTVISTADPKQTLLSMIEPQWLDPEIGLAAQNIKLRGCTAFVMYATDAAPPAALKSPVCLTSTTVALEKAADAAKYGEISAEPHVEVWSPTLRWPRLAEAGKHVVVARMQYAPNALKSGAWTSKESAALEKHVSAAVSRIIPNFANTVKHVRVLTPADIEKEFGATEGALTHGEMTLDQIMFMRPIPGWGRYAMPIRGLFLGGAGAHPGPGILGGAGLLAAKAALKR